MTGIGVYRAQRVPWQRRRRRRVPFGASAVLASGTASFVSSGPSSIVVTSSDATGGTPSYSYQWQRNANGGAFGDIANGGGVSGATSLTLTDGSATAGTLYGYRLATTDGAASQVTTNEITAQIYTGGSLTAGGISRSRVSGGTEMQIKQGNTTRHLVFTMIDSSDHISGKTGVAPTVTISKNGAAYASPSGAVTEIGNGDYKLAANATDANTIGMLRLRATGSGCDPTNVSFDVVVKDPDIDQVNVGKWLDQPVLENADQPGVPIVDPHYVNGDPWTPVSLPLTANATQFAGQAISASGAVNMSNLDAAISSRSTTSGIWSNGSRTLTADGLALIVIEAGVNIIQAIRGLIAESYGDLTDADTTNPKFAAVGDPGTIRIDAAVDIDGNRTNTLNLD